ncbi:MAG TPA: mechanosensitive ion channel family protein, partial [Nitrospirales bacterium]|nr:mechanosensitive ion channel family protein [Nitrospirales bacterium]
DIMLYCFTKTIVWGEWLETKERLAYKIKEIVEGEKASFAFPSRSLYVENLPLGQPEAFPLQPSDKRASSQMSRDAISDRPRPE